MISRFLASAILVAAVGIVSVLPGCFNVNVNADGWASKLDEKLQNKQAASIAKSKAKGEGIDPDLYVVSTKQEKDGSFYVSFARRQDAPTIGLSHFYVVVDASGKAVLHK